MNIFKPFTMTWWQVGVFKLCLLAAGIILGVYLHDFFLTWIAVVAVVCVLAGPYIFSIWWKQQKTGDGSQLG